MSQLDRTTPGTGLPLPRSARLSAAAVGRRWRLPRATGQVRVLRDLYVPMRDGAVLRADVYLPTTPGPHPTVLVRSPYGRGAMFTLMLTLPFAARGRSCGPIQTIIARSSGGGSSASAHCT